MNNLWESSNIPAACESCGIDEPFYIPVVRTDMYNIRFQVPFYLVALNGGGLPVGTNVRIDLVDESGMATFCSMGHMNNGRFMWSRYVGTSNAEYQFYMPIPFADQLGFNYSHAYVDVNVGQSLKIENSFTAADVEFTYGVDATPPIFQEIRPGRLVFPYRVPGATLNVLLNNVPVSFGFPYSASTCLHENFICYRIKLTINFPTAGITKSFFTKPIRVSRGCDDSSMMHTYYPPGQTDCNGYVHDGIMTPAVADVNRLFIRIPGMLSTSPSRIKRTYNSKCFPIKAERQKMYQLNAQPMPEWFVSEVENVALGKIISIDNTQLMLDSGDSLFSAIDVPGYLYQYIDVSLASCKCEKIFNC